MRVSVCVPAFERVEMLTKLIASFESQEFDEKELCISDDSRTSAVADAVSGLDVAGLVYKRNPTNIGYHHNLLSALEMASGDVAVVLGDDDVFACRSAISEYAAVFSRFPDARFAYGNLLQIDESDRITLSYRFFDHTEEFGAGAPSLLSLMLRSILITGMAFRIGSSLSDIYPSNAMLFPQVDLVRQLLLRNSGVGIASYLCATRAWSEQLGFKENDKVPERVGPRHGNVEVLEIIGRLRGSGLQNEAIISELEQQVVDSYASNLINERILNGRSVVRRNVEALIEGCPSARYSWRLLLARSVARLVNPRFGSILKVGVRRIVAFWRLRDVSVLEQELALTLGSGRG